MCNFLCMTSSDAADSIENVANTMNFCSFATKSVYISDVSYRNFPYVCPRTMLDILSFYLNQDQDILQLLQVQSAWLQATFGGGPPGSMFELKSTMPFCTSFMENNPPCIPHMCCRFFGEIHVISVIFADLVCCVFSYFQLIGCHNMPAVQVHILL